MPEIADALAVENGDFRKLQKHGFALCRPQKDEIINGEFQRG